MPLITQYILNKELSHLPEGRCPLKERWHILWLVINERSTSCLILFQFIWLYINNTDVSVLISTNLEPDISCIIYDHFVICWSPCESESYINSPKIQATKVKENTVLIFVCSSVDWYCVMWSDFLSLYNIGSVWGSWLDNIQVHYVVYCIQEELYHTTLSYIPERRYDYNTRFP